MKLFRNRPVQDSRKHPDFPFTPQFRAVLMSISAGLVIGALAWITHVVTCLMNGSWIFGIAGAVVFPVGVFHGLLVWLGIAG